MLIRYSILTAASGSLGGITASHGRSGQYARARTVPVDPASPFQNQVRIIFGNLSIAWKTLTNAQRSSWATYAANVPVRNRLGNTIFLTGHTTYIRNNAARIQAGLSRIDDGPTVFAAAVLTKVFVNPNGPPGLLESFFPVVDPWFTETGAAFLIYATRQNGQTVRFRRNPYRFAGAVLAPIEPAVPRVLIVPAPFALDDNFSNSIFVRYFIVTADGRMSPPVSEGPRLIKTT